METTEIDLPEEYRNLPPEINAALVELTGVDEHDLPLPALYLAAAFWAKIHGHVMLELFNLIQPVIAEVEAFYEYELQTYLRQAGFARRN